MPDPRSSAAAGRTMAGPPVSRGGCGAGLPEAEAEKTGRDVSLHPEADALPLAEAELIAQVADAADANISTPIMDSPTTIRSFFTIPPSGRFLLRRSCYT